MSFEDDPSARQISADSSHEDVTDWEKNARLVDRFLTEDRQKLEKSDLSEDERNRLLLAVKVRESEQEVLRERNQTAWDQHTTAVNEGRHFMGVVPGDVIYADELNSVRIMGVDTKRKEFLVSHVDLTHEEHLRGMPYRRQDQVTEMRFKDLLQAARDIIRIDKMEGVRVEKKEKESTPEKTSFPDTAVMKGEETAVQHEMEKRDVKDQQPRALKKHHVIFESDPNVKSEYASRAEAVQRLFTERMDEGSRSNFLQKLQTKLIDKPLVSEEGTVKILPHYFGEKAQRDLENVMQGLGEGKSISQLINEATALSGKEQLEALSALQTFGARLLHWRVPSDPAHWERMSLGEKAVARLAERTVLEVELTIVNIKFHNNSSFTQHQRDSFLKHFERYQKNLDISDEFRSKLESGVRTLNNLGEAAPDYKLQEPKESSGEEKAAEAQSADESVYTDDGYTIREERLDPSGKAPVPKKSKHKKRRKPRVQTAGSV